MADDVPGISGLTNTPKRCFRDEDCPGDETCVDDACAPAYGTNDNKNFPQL